MNQNASFPRATLSIIETATAFGVSRSTIYRMLRDGRLSATKLGRRTLVPASAISSLIASATPWRAVA